MTRANILFEDGSNWVLEEQTGHKKDRLQFEFIQSNAPPGQGDLVSADRHLVNPASVDLKNRLLWELFYNPGRGLNLLSLFGDGINDDSKFFSPVAYNNGDDSTRFRISIDSSRKGKAEFTKQRFNSFYTSTEPTIQSSPPDSIIFYDLGERSQIFTPLDNSERDVDSVSETVVRIIMRSASYVHGFRCLNAIRRIFEVMGHFRAFATDNGGYPKFNFFSPIFYLSISKMEDIRGTAFDNEVNMHYQMLTYKVLREVK